MENNKDQVLHFVFNCKSHIRDPKNHENYCKVEIDATDANAFVEVFAKLLKRDKGGLLKSLIQKAVLKAGLNDQ